MDTNLTVAPSSFYVFLLTFFIYFQIKIFYCKIDSKQFYWSGSLYLPIFIYNNLDLQITITVVNYQLKLFVFFPKEGKKKRLRLTSFCMCNGKIILLEFNVIFVTFSSVKLVLVFNIVRNFLEKQKKKLEEQIT